MARTPIPLAADHLRDDLIKVEVAWNGSTYTDESSRVISAEGVSELSGLADSLSGGTTIADSCRIDLDNTDGRFSPNNSGGALYALINPAANPANAGGYFRPIRVSLGFINNVGAAQYLQVFQGFIQIPTEDWADKTVTLDCLDNWAALRREARSTGLFVNKRTDQVLQEWLNASGYGFASSLEPSERIVEWAWLDDDLIADDIIRVTSADGGLVWFRYDGTLMYSSATWPARNTVSVYTFNTARFEALEPQWDFDAVYDKVVVTVKPRFVGLISPIWEADEEIVLDPGEANRDIEAHFSEPAYALITPTYSTDQAVSDWLALSAANAPLEATTNNLPNGTSLLTVTVLNVQAQRCTLRLTNGSPTHRMYVKKLRLRGQPIVAGREIVAEVGSGAKVLTVENTYLQNRAQAEALANALYQRFRYPRQTVHLRGVPARPHLDVTDRVTVTETETGISRDFIISRKAWRFGLNSVYVEDYDLFDAANLTAYGDYFRVGTSAFGDAAVGGSGRLWL